MENIKNVKTDAKIKSVVTWILIGYIIGVLISYYWLIHLPNNYALPLKTSKWIVAILICFLVISLCYSRDVRCTATLTIPILCSSKGRSLIIAFAFFIAATGPTKNIIRNVDVLTDSISCGQTQLKEALEKMLEVMKRPLVAIKNSIAMTMRELQKVMKKVQIVLLHIKEIVLVILAGIKNAFDWLGSIVSVCNKEFGTPFDRCMRIANDAMSDCRAKLGVIKGLCKVTHIFSMLCYTVKFIDAICVLVVFIDDTITQTILKRLNQFVAEVKQMFDVSITFDHDFYFRTIASNDLKVIGEDISQDLHNKMKNIFLVFGWLDILGSVLFLTVIIKALYFKCKYIRNTSFHNVYLTKDFLEIDQRRQETNQELALPLTDLEKHKYVWLSGCRLTRKELFKLARSMLFLTISCVQIFCICFVDYSIYWLLAMITYYGYTEAGLEVPPFITVDIRGGSFVGEIFRGIVHAFEPLSQNYTLDTKSCLPMPKRPSYATYYHLGGLCFLTWILLICQPYGLRLRHIIMRLYYPEVARERAAWLYQKILIKRTTFFKFARRNARSMFVKDSSVDGHSFADWLREKCWICRVICGRRKGDYCIVCSKPVADDKIVCETLGCNAIYCENCFKESNNNCIICKSPIDYGDLSDISEAKDSSENLNEDDRDLDCG